jgi:hypothetical protein
MAAGNGISMVSPLIFQGKGVRLPSCFFQAVLLLLILSVSVAAEARQAAIDEIVVANSDRHALLYAKVVNGFTPEMETALQNGMPVTFSFSVELYKSRKPWPDQRIAILNFDHTLSYDNLKEEYRIELQEKSGKTLAAHSLAEALKLMTEINGLQVIPLAGLDPGDDYLLKIKAKLARKTLPLDVQTLIPFWGLRDFKTAWHLVEFRY